MARSKAKAKAKTKAKRTAKAPKTKKRAPKDDMLEVVTRRAAIIENRAVGVKTTTRLQRFKPSYMTVSEFEYALKNGYIRQADILQTKPVKGGKS